MSIIKHGHIPDNNPDKLRWNQRFNELPITDPKACWILRRYQDLLPASGTAIDLASGRGGNALLLAGHGLDTSAWDISDTALQQLEEIAVSSSLSITTCHADLEQHLPEAGSADVLVVSHYLQRDVLASLSDILIPGGLLFYQTFVKTECPSSGPRNPEWRLDKHELLKSFPGLDLLAYHEDNDSEYPPLTGEGLAGIVAQKPAISSTP